MNIYKVRVSQINNELVYYENLNMSEWSVLILNNHKSIKFKYPPISITESEYIRTTGKSILHFDGCPNYMFTFIVDLDHPNQSNLKKQIIRDEKIINFL